MVAQRLQRCTSLGNEGFGTWPFGEEWLWEAVATSYLPLLELFDRLGTEHTRSEVTLSLMPMLCDQLVLREVIARCIEFLKTIRPLSRSRDIDGFRTGSSEARLNSCAAG